MNKIKDQCHMVVFHDTDNMSCFKWQQLVMHFKTKHYKNSLLICLITLENQVRK